MMDFMLVLRLSALRGSARGRQECTIEKAADALATRDTLVNVLQRSSPSFGFDSDLIMIRLVIPTLRHFQIHQL